MAIGRELVATLFRHSRGRRFFFYDTKYSTRHQPTYHPSEHLSPPPPSVFSLLKYLFFLLQASIIYVRGADVGGERVHEEE
jgi:hypothetical protein